MRVLAHIGVWVAAFVVATVLVEVAGWDSVGAALFIPLGFLGSWLVNRWWRDRLTRL